MCLAISLNKKKYLQQFGELNYPMRNSLRISLLDALNYFVGHYSKRQTQILRMRFKKE